jgi:hypothetical protein
LSLRIRYSLIAGLGILAGLLVWLYLPLQAGQGGVVWGQPTNLKGFWWMVSGTLYRDYLFAIPTAALGERVRAWANTWETGVGLIGVGLATLGIVRLVDRWRGWLIATGLSFIAFNLYAIGYDTADSVVYLVSAFVIVSIWLGIGSSWLFRQMKNWGRAGRWSVALMMIIAAVTPIWTMARNRAALDLSGDHEVQRFCRSVIHEAPPNAVLSSTTDRQTFALWYCQHVEGQRPDLAIVDEGLQEFEWYRLRLLQTHPGIWGAQLGSGTPNILTEERLHCRIRREAQTGWLDCPRPQTE